VCVSADLLGRIEKAERAVGLDVIGRCDDALTTGGALTRLWRFVGHQSGEQADPALVPALFIRIVVEVVVSDATDSADPPGPAAGDAVLFALPDGRGQSSMENAGNHSGPRTVAEHAAEAPSTPVDAGTPTTARRRGRRLVFGFGRGHL
jgi:hypothetical protein